MDLPTNPTLQMSRYQLNNSVLFRGEKLGSITGMCTQTNNQMNCLLSLDYPIDYLAD